MSSRQLSEEQAHQIIVASIRRVTSRPLPSALEPALPLIELGITDALRLRRLRQMLVAALRARGYYIERQHLLGVQAHNPLGKLVDVIVLNALPGDEDLKDVPPPPDVVG
ncbi:MAG TPA: hypothetical protein VF546_17130 [Pyrinomonadaceae bacterium]|jgi:hypothetical protein